MTALVHADDQATFQTEVLDSEVPVVVDFWAAWCGPCRTVAPEVEALADRYGTAIKVVKVDVDANQAVAARYGIQGIPTIGLFESGQLTNQVVGARPRDAIESELDLTRFIPVKGNTDGRY
jgi:thioredoxin 1